MKLSEVFKSDFLKAEDLDEDTVVTIAGVEVKELGSGKDKDQKPVITFEELDKGLACNRTNAQTIAKLYGDDTDDWIGKQITLFATEVDFKGDQVLAIRVRTRAPKTTAPATAPAKTSTAPATATTSANPAATERARAWKSFSDKTTSYEPEERKTKWTEAIREVYPNKSERTLTADEWRDFALAVGTDYSEEVGGFLPPGM
jgi:hypothetical protein